MSNNNLSNNKTQCIGIIVSGGPAPGINTVIAASVIEATHRGIRAVGLRGGFECFEPGRTDALMPLSIPQVTPILATGGSILGTSRFNPFHTPETEARFVAGLRTSGIDALIVIGGEGSAYLSHQVATRLPALRIVHVPKTIDNDLTLPNNHPSFGFETARFTGTEIVETLLVDARTCERWYVATTMGRRAGFLALGLGLAAGATMTLIPEEYPSGSITPEKLADDILESVIFRAKVGKHYGVALLAEGLIDCLDAAQTPLLRDCPRDPLGRLIYSQIELGDILLPVLRARAAAAGFPTTFISKNIGYELRCHSPISFDREYTRFLGYGAVRLLAEGTTDCMVTRDFDSLKSVPLASLADASGVIQSRRVDLSSDLYQVARNFMVRPG